MLGRNQSKKQGLGPVCTRTVGCRLHDGFHVGTQIVRLGGELRWSWYEMGHAAEENYSERRCERRCGRGLLVRVDRVVGRFGIGVVWNSSAAGGSWSPRLQLV